MRVVVDTNVLAAALIRPSGWTARQLGRPYFTFLVPAAVEDELAAHETELSGNAGCSPREWRRRVQTLLVSLSRITDEEIMRFMNHPWARAARHADPRDAFLGAAAAAALADRIWTFDTRLLEALPGLAVLELGPPDTRGD